MHERFMHRCFELARKGAGQVSPNPMVGAVLVHDGRIIGEGWHQRYGEAHAEVNAVRSVSTENQTLIPKSTLYCSLEPCSHHGKTPPCVDLVLAQKIPRVVVSNTDPNPLVAGKGLEKLRAAGIAVTEKVLEAEGARLNRAFFTWIMQRRPYIVLKWAQSADGFIGKNDERWPISGPLTQRLVHRWRAESDAILVGTNTALVDNPRLDNRLFWGKSPLRVALDLKGKIPATHHLLDDRQASWILGPPRAGDWQQTTFHPPETPDWIGALLQRLHQAGKAILLVEGGARVLQQFLEKQCWDEIRVIQNDALYLHSGIEAPRIPPRARLSEQITVGTDRVRVFV